PWPPLTFSCDSSCEDGRAQLRAGCLTPRSPTNDSDSVKFVNPRSHQRSLLLAFDRCRTIRTMLAVERRRLIAETLRSRGVVSVGQMAETLGTTEITVRRDLRAMAKDGLLVRAHGGAVLPSTVGHEPSYSEKAHQAGAEKAAIARAALEMVRPGDSILLGPGTTTLALARLLGDVAELTAVTNSPLVAQASMASPRV